MCTPFTLCLYQICVCVWVCTLKQEGTDFLKVLLHYHLSPFGETVLSAISLQIKHHKEIGTVGIPCRESKIPIELRLRETYGHKKKIFTDEKSNYTYSLKKWPLTKYTLNLNAP